MEPRDREATWRCAADTLAAGRASTFGPRLRGRSARPLVFDPVVAGSA